MRTVNTTWLYFSQDDELVFKIDKSYVDLYPRRIWPAYQPETPPIPAPAGFTPTTDTVDNPVLRWKANPLLDYQQLLDGERPDSLRDALAACSRASKWAEELRRRTAPPV